MTRGSILRLSVHHKILITDIYVRLKNSLKGHSGGLRFQFFQRLMTASVSEVIATRKYYYMDIRQQ